MFVAMNLQQAFDLHVSCWLIVECYSEKYINTRCILFLGSLKTYKLKNDFEGSFLFQNVWRGIKWKFVYISFNRILSRPAKENWLFLKLIRIFLFFRKNAIWVDVETERPWTRFSPQLSNFPIFDDRHDVLPIF